MHVYFKNWNKCNPYSGNAWDGSAVWDSIVIYIVDSPPAPTAPDKTYCSSDTPTLTVTSPPVGGVFKWYKNANKTGYLATGASYTPSTITDPLFLSPGVNHYYVADGQVSGNLCEGPTEEVVLTIREALSQPGAIIGSNEVCRNTTGKVYSVPDDPPVKPIGGATEYLWSVPADWTITLGQGTKQITCNIGATSGNVSVVNRYPGAPDCSSIATTLSVTVSPLTVGGNVPEERHRFAWDQQQGT